MRLPHAGLSCVAALHSQADVYCEGTGDTSVMVHALGQLEPGEKCHPVQVRSRCQRHGGVCACLAGTRTRAVESPLGACVCAYMRTRARVLVCVFLCVPWNQADKSTSAHNWPPACLCRRELRRDLLEELEGDKFLLLCSFQRGDRDLNEDADAEEEAISELEASDDAHAAQSKVRTRARTPGSRVHTCALTYESSVPALSKCNSLK